MDSDRDREEDRKRFAMLRHSDDLSKRQHFWSEVLAWNDPQNASDLILRQAYFECLAERRSTGRSAKLKAFRESVDIRIGQDNQLLIEDYNMRILSALNCKRDDTIRVRIFLNDTDERHPNCHALGALESDPAKRLAVKITFPETQGETAEHWIMTTGDMNVLRVNTIVD